MIEKPYTFRDLTSEDIIPMCQIIEAVGIDKFADKIVKVQKSLKANGETDIEAGGYALLLEIAPIIISSVPKCKPKIDKFLSSISNLKIDEVKNLKFAVYTAMIFDLFKIPDFADFMEVASGLFAKK